MYIKSQKTKKRQNDSAKFLRKINNSALMKIKIRKYKKSAKKYLSKKNET